MSSVNDITEKPDPGIEEVTRLVASVGVGRGAIVGRGSGAFGSAEGRVDDRAGLEAHPDVGGFLGGDDGAGQGGWAVESGLRGWNLVVSV